MNLNLVLSIFFLLDSLRRSVDYSFIGDISVRVSNINLKSCSQREVEREETEESDILPKGFACPKIVKSSGSYIFNILQHFNIFV